MVVLFSLKVAFTAPSIAVMKMVRFSVSISSVQVLRSIRSLYFYPAIISKLGVACLSAYFTHQL